MAKTVSFVGTLTIANSQTASNILEVPQGWLTTGFIIVAPAALTGTVNIRGAMSDSATPINVAVNGSAQTLTANVINQFHIAGLKRIQIVSGASEGGQRVASVYATFDAKGIC